MFCRAKAPHEVMMCGQVKHVSIFSSLRPDWRLAKLLMSLPQEEHGRADRRRDSACWRTKAFEVVDSTRLLKPLLAEEGVLTRRKPNEEEERKSAYGRRIAAALSGFDLGQSVAIAERACVALEAMEGTDAMLRRAASAGERAAIDAGEGVAAAGASAVRRAGGRAGHHRGDEGNGRTILAVDARSHAAAGSRADAGSGGCGGDRDCGLSCRSGGGLMSRVRVAVAGAGQWGSNHSA